MWVLLLTACGGKTAPYSSHENLLSIATEFELLTPEDAYREAPGHDLTGQSVARVTMVRLSNYESLHPDRFTPEILMIRGRALEWLGDFDSALATYRQIKDSALNEEAGRRAEYLDEMLVARSLTANQSDLTQALDDLNAQARAFRELADGFDAPFYRTLAQRESENASVRRAELMAANRFILPNGEAEAQRSLESLVQNHRESRRAAEHALALARFHRMLAEEEMRLHPPEEGGFSAERFRVHYDAAADLLYRLTQADGRPERLIARHELDAVLALGEYVSQRAQ